ncbi:YecA family protein [Chlamydia sp. 17-3921]|uniref:YecA family protein n=1 Tax=Chlamydia sp. 17-3921 TaxID=2675798 RepID=UPI0019197177|nr:SEC-C metal-binding domain-containing protein [Chlamydia sp. 17-3921]
MSKKINRNDPCPCGSNKKYKQCCLKKESLTARHTSEGKFKFSATVLSKEDVEKSKESYTKLFQRVSAPLATKQKEQLSKYHTITKNKETINKKALNRAKAKEDLLVSEKLKQYDFQVLSTIEQQTKKQEVPSYSIESSSQNTNFSPDVFIPTQEDYRIAPKQAPSSEEPSNEESPN